MVSEVHDMDFYNGGKPNYEITKLRKLNKQRENIQNMKNNIWTQKMSWYTTDWIWLVWCRDGHAAKSSKGKIVGKQLDVLNTGPNTGKIHEDVLYKKA